MEKQPTVLLVRGIEMPRGIAEQLRKLGVHVEQASPAALGAVLTAFRLDMIVIGLSPSAGAREPILIAVQKSIRAAAQAIPLVALADWDEQKPPGARDYVDAVVPIDLPDPAIAHRLKSLAERALQGQSLDKRTQKTEKPSRRPLVPRAKPINRASLPRAESVADPVARVTARMSSPPPAALPSRTSSPPRPRRRTTPPPTSVEAEKIRKLCEDWEQGDPHNRLSDWLSHAGAEIPKRDTEPPASSSINPTVRPGAVARGRAELSTPTSDVPPAPSVSSTPHIGTSPSSIRVPLTTPPEPLPGVRLAIIDEDVTRADAIAATLRAHRVQVYLCSPSLEHFHARLLRKFAPHAVLVDEALLSGAASELIALIRQDPFLLHVRLLAVCLSRYFRPRTGATQIDALLPLVQPLAKAEQDLLAKLGPTCEVEFGFDEVPPHLLLKLLVPRSVSTQIECKVDNLCVTWTVGWNQAAPAELMQGGKTLQLSPQRAFDWLLAHNESRVVIIQRPERDPLVGEDILSLIDERLAQEPDLLSSRKTIENESAKLRSSPQIVHLELNDSISVPPPSHAPNSTNRPHAISQRAERRQVSKRGGAMVVGGALAAAAGLALLLAQSSPSVNHQPTAQLTEPSRDAVEPTIQATQPESKVSVTDAVAQQGVAAESEDRDESALRSNQKELTKAVEVAGPVFRIEPEQQAPDCDEVLGGWRPNPSQPREAGRIYFRQAQKDLVQGENGQAHFKLCQAAHLMPGGAGSLELARYYLGLRAYALSDKHLQQVLEMGDKSGEAQLLHGDLLNQQGQETVSRDIWLSAMQVEVEDEGKRMAVSRKYVRDARAALRYLDYALAERYLRRSVTLWRGNAEAAAMLSALFKKQGLEEAAKSWKEEALESR